MTEETKKNPSVMLATLMYGGMCTGYYVEGLLKTITRLQQQEIPVYWSHIMNESLITRARNELARVFLEGDCDYLMFIDADIGFSGDDVLRLMAADKDVVCGLYPKKEVNWEQVKRAAREGKEELEEFGGSFVFNMIGSSDAATDESGVIEVRHGGTGFMLIKRGVFDALAPHVPTYRVSTHKDAENNYVKPLTHEFFATSIDNTGALLSEDYHFCELVRAHGGNIFAHPFIKLEHVGTYVFGGDILKSGGKLL
jgi:hypothetical protein